MKGPIYDYYNQAWTEIDTDTDTVLDKWRYETPDKVRYEVNPADRTQYRNLPAMLQPSRGDLTELLIDS